MPTVQILLGGSDITDKVVFAQTSFQSKVNGQPGQGKMRVRDDDSTFTFTVGADWLLLIDGDAAWRGFAMQRKLAYIAPAMDVAESGLQRFVDVWGPDGNILFSRRVVAKTSSPATVEGTQFPAATADTTAITELISNWLDLSADSIDTSSGVTHVGNLDPAQKTRAWSGGWVWGDAMNTIAMLPAAIYYLRPESGTPDYTLVYCDADAPTAPFGLSDQPDGTTTKGYRESEIILDATGMINDELAWGMGYGSQTPVFKRLTSTSSVSAHGLWQGGTQAVGVYKQATIDRIADSIVNGSPSNHRGAKNDRPAVELVTYQPGLLAGHVVDFDSQVWGWSDAIPVRQSDITFEAPDLPRWKLLLSHEIDTPWGFYDQFWPKLPGWPPPCLTPPCIGGTGTPVPTSACQCIDPITGHDRCTDVQFDDFERTVASGWGTATPSGYAWTVSGPGGATYSVDGSAGRIDQIDSGTVPNQHGTTYVSVADTAGGWAGDFDMTAKFHVNALPDAAHTGTLGNWGVSLSTTHPLSGSFDQGIVMTKRDNSNGGLDTVQFIPSTGGSVVAYHSWAVGSTYWVRWVKSGTSHKVRVWDDGATEPSTWDIDTTDSAITPLAFFVSQTQPFTRVFTTDPDATMGIWWDSIDFDYAGRPCYYDCTALSAIDDFERTDVVDLGTATPSGIAWTYFGSGSVAYSVDGHSGIRSYGSDLTGVAATGARLALPTSYPEGVEFYTEFSASGEPVSGFLSWGENIAFGSGSGVGSAWDIIEVSALPVGFATTWAVTAQNGPGTTTFRTSSAGDASSWWSVRVQRLAGSVRVKAWLRDSEAEPDWQADVARSSSVDPSTAVVDWGGHGANSPSAFGSASLAVLSAGNAGCVPADRVPVGAPTGPTGWGCEVPTRSSSTVYTTTVTFTAGSVLAWRAGLLQRPGTDYTEGSGLQSITFTTAVATGEEVRVCYLAQVVS